LKKVRKTVEEFKSGQMDQDTMGSGEMEWPMDMVVLYMLKEMSMRVNGQRIKQMVLEFILIITEVGMKDNGSKINNTDMVLNNGQMVQNTKVNMNKV
jgi:hypothetical protein